MSSGNVPELLYGIAKSGGCKTRPAPISLDSAKTYANGMQRQFYREP